MIDTTTEPARPANWSEQRDMLRRLVIQRVAKLQAQYCQSEPMASAKAALAQLRRGSSTSDPSMALLGVDAFAVDVHTNVPDHCYPLNRDGNPVVLSDKASQAEIAVYTAMTMYAIHQQSRRDGLHRLGDRPGAAFARIARNGSEAAARRRFAALITATDFAELAHHLRTSIRLLRDGEIKLDYGQLAADLFTWQSTGGRDRVRLAWSRDFEYGINRQTSETKKDES